MKTGGVERREKIKKGESIVDFRRREKKAATSIIFNGVKHQGL